jgi:hypothetical protein
MHTHSPNKSKKFKQTSACQKADGNSFLGQHKKGVLAVEFIQQETTITSELLVYCETLKQLRRAIQNKSHGMLTYSVVLLHDNVQPHTAARTEAPLQHFNWELFDHPP